jgi:hypothetical protein
MKHVPPLLVIDLLTHAIEITRPYLDQSVPIGKRAQDFWAAVIAARDLSAADVIEREFTKLAQETGLTRELGEDSVVHVIRFAFLDLNPFC